MSKDTTHTPENTRRLNLFSAAEDVFTVVACTAVFTIVFLLLTLLTHGVLELASNVLGSELLIPTLIYCAVFAFILSILSFVGVSRERASANEPVEAKESEA